MILRFDHIVLTVSDPDRAAAFYARVLKAEAFTFAGHRRAVRFGDQKINLQRLGDETRNHAAVGSGDSVSVTDWPVERTLAHLKAEGVEVIEGPVTKSGALGPMTSIYFCDEDGNLVEISRYED